MLTKLWLWFNSNLNMFERILYMTLGVYSVLFTVYLFKREVNFIHDEEMYWMGRRWLNEEARKLDKCERVRNYYRNKSLRLEGKLPSSANTSLPIPVEKPTEVPIDDTSVEELDEPQVFNDGDLASTLVGMENAKVLVHE